MEKENSKVVLKKGELQVGKMYGVFSLELIVVFNVKF
jgi:hypothetical protein